MKYNVTPYTILQVFYCDYGNSDTIPGTALYQIPVPLTLIPQQSIPCSLEGIMEDQEGVWSGRAVQFFVDKVYNKGLYAVKRDVMPGLKHKVWRNVMV